MGLHVLVRVRADGRLRQRFHLGGVEQDTRVQGEDTIWGGNEGVDVALHNLGVVHDHDAESHHDFLELVGVDTLHASNTLQGLVDLGLMQHLGGQVGVERRKAQGGILEDLDQGAAHAEEDDRAELRVEAGAEDDLVALHADHGLDGDALEALRGGQSGHALLHLGEGLLDLGLASQVQLDTAHIELVGDGRRVELHDDREANLLGRLSGFLGGLGHFAGGDG
mmetsp:Transcript_69491/g.145134  ORF Transcript_69491/g.145134 Transcript_69491/m.145134 type:complete len:223 (+) Transcript_69491:1020-1688(+)